MPLGSFEDQRGQCHSPWEVQRQLVEDSPEDATLGAAAHSQGTHLQFPSIWAPPGHTFGPPGGSDGKESAFNARDLDSIPDWEDFLEKEMATHSSTPTWKIPWTEKPGGLQSMG